MRGLQSTPEGKVALYHSETGQRIDRWPVDAVGMIKSGEYVATPPEGAEPVPAPTPEQLGLRKRSDVVVPRDIRTEGAVQAGNSHVALVAEPDADPATPKADGAPEKGADEPTPKKAEDPIHDSEGALLPWELKVDPAAYIERWPEGPQVALAHAHIDAGTPASGE